MGVFVLSETHFFTKILSLIINDDHSRNYAQKDSQYEGIFFEKVRVQFRVQTPLLISS